MKATSDFWFFAGIAVLVLACCHSCTHCQRHDREMRLMDKEIEAKP